MVQQEKGPWDVAERAEQAEKALRSYTPLQMMFLSRLQRLTALRDAYQADPQRQKWLLDALNWTMYSTFMDCVSQGVKEEANAILRRESQVN